MGSIPLNEATERLAAAVERAAPADLIEIYSELAPAADRPGPNESEGLAGKLAGHIRRDIKPEEVADLWNVVFPSGKYFYYDEEEGGLCEQELCFRYAEI